MFSSLWRRLVAIRPDLADPPSPRPWRTTLDLLAGGPMSGRELRRKLWAAGEWTSGPGFYRMMARMEEAGLTEGWYEELDPIDGQVIKQRWHRRTEG